MCRGGSVLVSRNGTSYRHLFQEFILEKIVGIFVDLPLILHGVELHELLK